MNPKALFAVPLLAASFAAHASFVNYEFDLHVDSFTPSAYTTFVIDPFLAVGRTYIGVFSVDSSVLAQDGDYRPGLIDEIHVSFDGWQGWDKTPGSPLSNTEPCFDGVGYHPCTDPTGGSFWGISPDGPYHQGFTFDVVNGEIAAIRGYLGSPADFPSLDFSLTPDSLGTWDLDGSPIGTPAGEMTLHRLPEPPTYALALMALFGAGAASFRRPKK
jgi:hypothetical protein